MKKIVFLLVALFVTTGCGQKGATSQLKPPHYGIFLEHKGQFTELPDRSNVWESAKTPNVGSYPSRLIIYAEPGWNLSNRGIWRLDNSNIDYTSRLIPIGDDLYEVQPDPPFERGVSYTFFITAFPSGPQKVFVLK